MQNILQGISFETFSKQLTYIMQNIVNISAAAGCGTPRAHPAVLPDDLRAGLAVPPEDRRVVQESSQVLRLWRLFQGETGDGVC